jgi:hypothetical protein
MASVTTWGTEAFVGSRKGEDRGGAESAMGKGARECQTETERRQRAEKEDDVSRRSKENCRCSTSAVGEGEGCAEEVRIRRHLGSQWGNSRPQS